MKLFIKKILNKFSYFKLNKNMQLTVGNNTIINFRSFDLKTKNKCKFKIGEKSMVSASFVFEKDEASIEIGNNTFMGGSVISCAENIKIGDNVHVAWNATIFDHNAHPIDYRVRRNDLPNLFIGKKDWKNIEVSPTIIEDDAWIGVNVIILKGLTIGKGLPFK